MIINSCRLIRTWNFSFILYYNLVCCVVQGLELDCLWGDWLSSCTHCWLGEILKADISWNSIFFFNFPVGRWCGGLRDSWVLLWETELCSLSWLKKKCLFYDSELFTNVKDLLSELTSQKFSRTQCFPFLVLHEGTVHVHHDRQAGRYTSQVLSLWENGSSIAESWMLLCIWKYRNYSVIQSTYFSINGEYETTYMN